MHTDQEVPHGSFATDRTCLFLVPLVANLVCIFQS